MPVIAKKYVRLFEEKMMLEWLTILLMGITEGLTEYLPISSTGHLILLGDVLNFNDEKGKVFEIVIQLGAVLAVCFAYRARLTQVVMTLPRSAQSQQFVMHILIAFLPAVVLGVLFHKIIKQYLFNPLNVGIMLVLGGVIIFLVEQRQPKNKIDSLEKLDKWTALKIGLAQCCAMIPGTSRSGATIIGGLLFGLSRPVATEFSFFLAIPTMFGAVVYDLYKNRAILSFADLPMFSIGFVAAFLSGLIAVKLLLKYVSTHNFLIFAYYRIVFGVIIIIFYSKFHF